MSRTGILCLVGYLTLSLITGVFIAEGALHPQRRPLSAAFEAQAQEMAFNHHSKLASVVILARDGATLSAWSIQPHQRNGKVVILLHGVGDNRMGMVSYAEVLLSHGFSVLIPDARAHGASGGGLSSYGLLESDDIHRWFNWLQQTQHPACIFGLAESMGAAQLLQSLQGEARFCAVVAESSFSSLREVTYDRIGQYFHGGPWIGRTVLRPVVEVAFGYARWHYQLNFDQLSPEKIVTVTRVPVFLIHGLNDSNIPVRHSRRIAANNSALSLWEVPDAGHCGALGTARREFEHRLMRWFDDHSGNPGAVHSNTNLDLSRRRPAVAGLRSHTILPGES